MTFHLRHRSRRWCQRLSVQIQEIFRGIHCAYIFRQLGSSKGGNGGRRKRFDRSRRRRLLRCCRRELSFCGRIFEYFVRNFRQPTGRRRDHQVDPESASRHSEDLRQSRGTGQAFAVAANRSLGIGGEQDRIFYGEQGRSFCEQSRLFFFGKQIGAGNGRRQKFDAAVAFGVAIQEARIHAFSRYRRREKFQRKWKCRSCGWCDSFHGGCCCRRSSDFFIQTHDLRRRYQ